MSRRKIVLIALAAILIVVAAIFIPMLIRAHDTSADDIADATVRAADSARLDPAAVARGHAIAIAADCAACHTRIGDTAAYAGGYTLETPFGAIVSSNITPDRNTGIGDWTERDFFRAVRHGQSPRGLLYPAMPYPACVQITDRDMHDLWTYFRSVKPVASDSGGTRLPFPFNIRQMVAGWNMLFFDNLPFRPDAAKPATWNRGRYLVDALGHCAACHSPKNLLGADKAGAYLAGGTLQGWHAPDITNSEAFGLGSWSEAEIVGYLKTGSNNHAVAAGPMAEAVELSTQFMPQSDLAAMAGYLKSLPGAPAKDGTPDRLDAAVLARGKRIYVASCSACHGPVGEGIPGMATRLAHNSSIRAPDPASLIHVVLKGGRAARTISNPTGAGMPGYGWKLEDADVAAVLTHVRNSWGNAAPAVRAQDVKHAREAFKARDPIQARDDRNR